MLKYSKMKKLLLLLLIAEQFSIPQTGMSYVIEVGGKLPILHSMIPSV